ncbi:hypothetical protein APS67_000235 [Streptomyces sp. AVP053U2]|nr:hypothetical protein APS67_000235 [Streptomyces sp. AVP053U2]
MARLASLGLSMGALGDEGAAALPSGQPLTHLRALDLHHHYLGDAMVLRVREALEPAGVRGDLSEQEQEEDEGTRYVVAERLLLPAPPRLLPRCPGGTRSA